VSDAGAGSSGARHELVAPAGAPRLDLFVAAALDLSRTQSATLIANGQVSVEGRAERASYRPSEGERVVVDIVPPTARPVIAEEIPLTVVYEDDEVLVVDKPAGMVVHPAPGNWSGTLVNALKGRGGAHGLRAACPVRFRRSVARAPAHRTHAPDSCASVVHRSSGGGRRYVRRRRWAEARFASEQAAFSACGVASLSPSRQRRDGRVAEHAAAGPGAVDCERSRTRRSLWRH
jgi:ribosomal 50S subunit-recycling heat shock protein